MTDLVNTLLSEYHLTDLNLACKGRMIGIR